MPDDLSRRGFVQASIITAMALSKSETTTATPPDAAPAYPHPILTAAEDFGDVSRGNPKPFTLKGDALVKARLTDDTWRLEVAADPFVDAIVKQPATLSKPMTEKEGSAMTMAGLLELGKRHEVKYLKAMQCLNVPTELGQGLWEGLPLREILLRCGKMSNVRRVYYWGFHNEDERQMFRSSLSYTEVMETPPGELPAFVAYRLNGKPIPLIRGGPVRMIVPWAHGFKSIKWLQQIRVTNDFRANDTYANANNDPESHLKTAAYVDDLGERFAVGADVFVSGLAIVGLSGLKRVEYWLRQVDGEPKALADDDPAWAEAKWEPCVIADAPKDWQAVLPAGVAAGSVLGFDPHNGTPAAWPMRYVMVSWSAKLAGLKPGKYEVRARAVDENGFAQPEPRPLQKTGKNAVQMKRFIVGAGER